MKLVGEDGELITAENKPGEAFIKTPTLFSGYLDNLDANEHAFDSDGFYRTGDQIFVGDGHLYYKDRIKETLKVKGWQVSREFSCSSQACISVDTVIDIAPSLLV